LKANDLIDDVISHIQGIASKNKKLVTTLTTGGKTSFTSVTRLFQ